MPAQLPPGILLFDGYVLVHGGDGDRFLPLATVQVFAFAAVQLFAPAVVLVLVQGYVEDVHLDVLVHASAVGEALAARVSAVDVRQVALASGAGRGEVNVFVGVVADAVHGHGHRLYVSRRD